jgi:hypothetical protein
MYPLAGDGNYQAQPSALMFHPVRGNVRVASDISPITGPKMNDLIVLEKLAE